jgi:histidine triad (HIT) family protein
LAVAFEDIHPQAPTHVLVVPRKHITLLAEMTPEDEALVGHLYRVAPGLKKEARSNG